MLIARLGVAVNKESFAHGQDRQPSPSPSRPSSDRLFLRGVRRCRLITLGALFNIASTLDQQEKQRSAFHATQALEQRLLASRQFLSSYAVWDAAFEHLAGKVDWQWAYEEKNVGESLYSASGYEGVFVVDDRHTTYALFKGAPAEAPAGSFIDAPLTEIIAAARAAASARGQVNRFVLFNNWPAVLSAAAVRPDKEVTTAEVSQAPVMLFIDQLTEAKLARLGEVAGLAHMHIEKNEEPEPGRQQIALGDTGYRLGWTSPMPGRQLLWAVLPPLLCALLILGVVLLYLFRLALRNARVIDLSLQHLQTSNQALEASEQRFRAVAEASSDWIWETDRQQRLTYLPSASSVLPATRSRHGLANHSINCSAVKPRRCRPGSTGRSRPTRNNRPTCVAPTPTTTA